MTAERARRIAREWAGRFGREPSVHSAGDQWYLTLRAEDAAHVLGYRNDGFLSGIKFYEDTSSDAVHSGDGGSDA